MGAGRALGHGDGRARRCADRTQPVWERGVFFSNITAARLSASPDLTTGVGGWTSLTEYVGDAGFVAVTPQEVGVFWSFWPI
jgi:hypothetical protein